PYLASAADISAFTSSSRPTSAVTARPSMSPATCASRSRVVLRSATTTPRAPASANARAVASPMPLAPPVTTQTLPLMCMRCSFLAGLVQPFVARPLDRQPRDQVEHRCREIGGARKRRRCAHQHVDLHRAAELVVL